MKKNVSLLTGIVFLIALMIAGGCKTGVQTEDPLKVKDIATDSMVTELLRTPIIVCEAVEDSDGNLQFQMWDHNAYDLATSSEDDRLKINHPFVTDVQDNNVVIWKWSHDSEVKEFVEIGPLDPNPKIFPGKANPQNSLHRVYLIITKNTAVENDIDGYYIKFIWKGDTVTVDPYLQVPPTP